MPLKNVTQSGFVRGINAAFSLLQQPKGSVPRGSNCLLTRRGALKTCDGSKILAAFQGMVPLPYNPLTIRMWREIFLFQPSGGQNGYFGIITEPGKQLGSPAAPTLSATGTGLTGTFNVLISALDGAGGETVAGPFTAITVANQSIHATWPLIPNAAGYNVYVVQGFNAFLALPVGSSTTDAGPSTLTNSFDITASVVHSTYGGVSVNTTQSTVFCSIPVTGNGFDYLGSPVQDVRTFPASILPNLYTGVAGLLSTGGSSGAPGTGGGTANGGVTGALGPLPLIVPFANKMFLALGNGISPYQSDGTAAGTTAITNTFTAAFPARQNTTGYIEGDQIAVTVGGTDYVFQAVQGGTTAGSSPTFSAILGQTVADGGVLWKNVGQVSNSPAPRGAAHAEVYAGSLWVANTSPSITSDLLDGPCAIRMSTANNPDSWNPLNAAQISRDDGQEITGIKAFAVAEAGIPTTQQLVIFKDTSTFVINGVFGAPDFAIQQAQTDQGCIAPRTVQFVPGYGLCRFTHLGFSIFDGLQDRLISEEIRPYIFGGQDDINPVDFSFAYFSKAAQAIFPPMYICACPLVRSGEILFTSIDPGGFALDSELTADAVNLPSGNYYVKVSLRGPAFETAITPEFGPFAIVKGPGGGSTTCIHITGPALPAGYLGWRVYYGNSPGGESQFIDVPSLPGFGAQSVFITSVGQPGLPPTGIPAQLTRVFCYDLVLKAWAIVDLPFSISVLRQFRTPGSTPITISGGFYDTTVRRVFGGDADWDGSAISVFFQGAEVFGEDGSQRIFYRRLVIRGVGNNPDLSITPTLDGIDQPALQAVLQLLGANQFDARIDIQQTCENFHATLRWTGQLEIDSLNSQVAPKPVGATARVFS